MDHPKILGAPVLNLYSFTSAVAFTVYLFLAVHVLMRPNRRTARRWVFAFFAMLYAAWSVMYAFMSSAPSEEQAWLLIRAFSFSWTLSASAFLHFALLHSERIVPRQWLIQAVVYVPGIVFAVKGALGPLFFDDLVRVNGAWVEVTSVPNPWALAYAAYYYGAILSALVLIGVHARRSHDYGQQRQALLMTMGYLITATLIAIDNFVIPALGAFVPRIAHLLTLVWIGSIWYAMQRYDFFRDLKTSMTQNPLWKAFTRREREIVALLVRAHSYKEIAAALGISLHTVKSHVERIYQKAQVSSRAQLLYQLGTLHADLAEGARSAG